MRVLPEVKMVKLSFLAALKITTGLSKGPWASYIWKILKSIHPKGHKLIS